ncbi:MAG: autotransporter domain-containing protein [Candidatus Accumulibacter sp.]|nr:autotransporter domain-containing protein [Accumulibacter sp.]
MQQPKRHQKTILAGALLLAFLPICALADPVPGHIDYDKVLQSLQSNYYGSSGIETIAGLRDSGTASNSITATIDANKDKTFHIGSQSKMYTTSALLYMMDKNINGLSAADLNRTLAQIRDAQSDAAVKAKLNELIETLPEGARGYTLREFMSMGTMLPNFMAGNLPDGNIWDLWKQAGYGPVPSFNGNTPANHLKLVELARQGFPGKAPDGFNYFYSNTNAVVLALMAEAVSGKNFEALIQEYVVGKISGLNSSNTYLSTAPGVAGMVGTEEGVLVNNLDPTIPWTSGAMVTDMNELLTFLDAINHTGFLNADLTAARTADMNTIPMSGMEIDYGLGLMNLVWGDLLGGFAAYVKQNTGIELKIPDVVSTGHGGSIAGSSSFSGWLASATQTDLDKLGLAVYANSLTTIDKGGYFTATPSEALFTQAVEHLYRTARANGTKDGANYAYGTTGGYITQEVLTGTGFVFGGSTESDDIPLIAYLDLRGDPDGAPFRITQDPSYTYYSAKTDGSAEVAVTVASGNALDLAGYRIEGYGADKSDDNTFTMLKVVGGNGQQVDGEVAAYGENAIALSHSDGTLDTLTLTERSRLYSKGINGIGLETKGTVNISSGGYIRDQNGQYILDDDDNPITDLNPLETNFGITSAILAEGSGSIGIKAGGSDAKITLNPGASVGAVTYAGFRDEDSGTIYTLDSEFKPVDEQKYSVRGVSLSDGATLTNDGGSIDATATYPWDGVAGGGGTLAIGVELAKSTLVVKNEGSVSASGYGVNFIGDDSSTLTLSNDASVWGNLASLHASSDTPNVAVTAEESMLVGRIALADVQSTSSLVINDSVLDFSLQYPDSEALVQFGGSELSVDNSNAMILPLSPGVISLVYAPNVSNLASAFAPELHTFGGDAFTVAVGPGYNARLTGFTNDSPNSARMFPVFLEYATDKFNSGAFASAAQTWLLTPDGDLTPAAKDWLSKQKLPVADPIEAFIGYVSEHPERLTAETHATQTAVSMGLHTSVQNQVSGMIDGAFASQNSGSRLGQNIRNTFASHSGKKHNVAHMEGEMWHSSALTAAETRTPLHASGGIASPTTNYRFFGGYIHSERDQHSRKGYAGYDHDANGLLLGVAAELSQNFDLAFFAGASSGETKYSRLASKIKSDGLHLGTQARYSYTLSDASTLRLAAHLDYSRLDNDSARYAYAGTDKIKGKYHQKLVGGGLKATLEKRLGADVTLSPYASLDALHLKQDSLNEHGGPTYTDSQGKKHDLFALRVKGESFTRTYATLGIGASRDIELYKGFVVTPKVTVGWRHAFEQSTQSVTANFQGYSDTFKSRTLDEGRNTLLGGVSVDLKWLKTARPVVARFEYNYQRQDKASDHQLYLGLEARF